MKKRRSDGIKMMNEAKDLPRCSASKVDLIVRSALKESPWRGCKLRHTASWFFLLSLVMVRGEMKIPWVLETRGKRWPLI